MQNSRSAKGGSKSGCIELKKKSYIKHKEVYQEHKCVNATGISPERGISVLDLPLATIIRPFV